jgi:hypothetical protein
VAVVAMTTPNEARAQLEKFLSQLREMAEREKQELHRAFFIPTISFDLIDYVADGIERYLKGEAPSLDAAFRLKARGRPKTNLRKGKHFELAKKVFGERIRGKSWERICKEINYNDPRELKRIEKRYRNVVIEDYGRKIAENIQHRRLQKSKQAQRLA